jgi:hypothetical protein
MNSNEERGCPINNNADDFSDDEYAAVVTALKEKLDREVKYRMAPRMAPFLSALAKLDPASAPKPMAERPPLPEAPMRSRGGRRARR